MAYPTPAQSVTDLLHALDPYCRVEGPSVRITRRARLSHRRHQDARMDGNVLGRRGHRGRRPLAGLGGLAGAGRALGEHSRAVHGARPAARSSGFTVPAVNLRTQVFDMAAAMCRAADSIDAGTIIFELARSEQEYTFQRPGEYITSVLAGCIAAGWRGPVFVQGDHYQFNASNTPPTPRRRPRAIRKADTRRDRASATATSTSIPRRSSTSRSRPSTSSSAPTTSAPPSSRRSSARTSRPG